MQFRTKAYLLDEITICYYNNNNNNNNNNNKHSGTYRGTTKKGLDKRGNKRIDMVLYILQTAVNRKLQDNV